MSAEHFTLEVDQAKRLGDQWASNPASPAERTEAEEIATDTVASTLEILSYVPSSMLTHDRMGEVLYMLAKVLRHPEILV